MTSETARSHRVPTPAAMMPQNAVALAWARPGDAGVVYRAHRLWRVAGLTPIGVHECRHIFASLMIAAGVNIKALQVFMGEASITVTLDRYGHLLLGSETEAAALLDAYLTAARTGARGGHERFCGTRGTLFRRCSAASTGEQRAHPSSGRGPETTL